MDKGCDCAVHCLNLRYDFPLNESSHRYHAQHIASILVAVSLTVFLCMQLDRYSQPFVEGSGVAQQVICTTWQPLDTRSSATRWWSRNGEAIGKAGERGAERSGDQAQKLGASLAPSNIR